jgi:hypothetical protein
MRLRKKTEHDHNGGNQVETVQGNSEKVQNLVD